MGIKLQVPKVTELKPRIVVVGVGGAGGNAISNMIASGIAGVDFVAANTDAQALAASTAEHRIQLGVNLTEGLGAGSKPEIGEAAAEEAVDEIRSHIAGAHMVFVAAGMGGGTGTGAATVFARVARELGILTVAIVTKPFHFEGTRRMRTAEAGIAELRKHVDTLIVIPNQNLFRIANEKTTFAEAFMMADQVLHSGISCVTDLIVKEGLINLDFADVRTVMTGMGSAMMGTGTGTGPRRAIQAAEQAILNPLLDDVSLQGAKGLLISISGNRDLTLYEVDEAANRIREEVDPEANIIVGATFDETLGDKVRVSIVASGLGYAAAAEEPRASRPATQQPSPPSRNADPKGDQVKRRLGEALGGPPGGGKRFGAGFEAQPEPMRYSTPDRGSLRNETEELPEPRTWDGPDEVVIELANPHVTARRERPAAETGQGADRERSPAFTPMRPAEIRRPPRRMPEVADFPPVAQREYAAKQGGKSSEKNPVEKRRSGLFARLTGRGPDAFGDGPDDESVDSDPLPRVLDGGDDDKTVRSASSSRGDRVMPNGNSGDSERASGGDRSAHALGDRDDPEPAETRGFFRRRNPRD